MFNRHLMIDPEYRITVLDHLRALAAAAKLDSGAGPAGVRLKHLHAASPAVRTAADVVRARRACVWAACAVWQHARASMKGAWMCGRTVGAPPTDRRQRQAGTRRTSYTPSRKKRKS